MNAVDNRNAGVAWVTCYVAEVEDHLLTLPYKERAEVLEGLADHLREAPARESLPEPSDYARALAEDAGAAPRPLRLMGLATWGWPTPAEWLASGIRGVAALYALAILWSVTLTIGSDVVAGGGSLLSAIDHGVGAVMRVPQLAGSERLGALVYLPLFWMLGQLTTGVLLDRSPRWRARLRVMTRWAMGILGGVALYIIVDLFR